ncbi:hypothetical protein BCR35DRAFT_7233 [Leucosporidium creatinivorum]|uniref:Macrofage activating glycoprotein n=1 Tax=Leucosporidium creatinivorum TaxID=106004 RepID=A0A1Y2G5W1_9BASI|nr:hypothetical protein BCR35DRAFT_7233 [Leucosporidium creatinivorum]
MASTFLSAALLALAATTVSASPSVTITDAPHPTLVARAASETTSPLPLTQYTYAYADIPYKVNPYAVGRGPQSGYNQCNSTTEGPDSQCQTALLNSIDDFCLWGAPGTTPNQTIGDVEAAVVAYCTKSGHGARILPAGAITGLQVLKTSAYTQWTGYINQTALNLQEDDSGGELDPHGADELGNPLGGLVYSSGLPTGDNVTEAQVFSWNNFIGSGVFCFKVCDPSVTDKNYCQNIYDLIGCSYNMPAAYEDNVFLECDSDLQDEVGTYTSDGQTYTWSQPTSLPATSTLPWTPRVPSSSNCVTYQSAALFPASDLGYQSSAAATAAAASTTASGASAAATASGSASSRSGSASTSATKTGSSTAASSTSSSTSGASSLFVSGGAFAVVLGTFAAML